MNKETGRIFIEDQLYPLNPNDPFFRKEASESHQVLSKLSERVGKEIEEIFANKEAKKKISK
jgi:hypothetical protein